jgi:cytoskeletal protein CcmA (bactofilin family)
MTTAQGSANPPRDLKVGIGAGVTVTGDVECEGEMQISGQVNGDVRCKVLFVEAGGAIAGNVSAEQVRISGVVDGNIATGDLAIEQSGKASGIISYARLKVAAGGALKGTLEQTEGSSAASGPLKLVEPPANAEGRRVFGD